MRNSTSTDHRVQEVLNLIESRFSEPWTLEEFAFHVNVSARHLDRLFQDSYSVLTPIPALKARRMDQAATLLCTTNLRVKEIMVAVGIIHYGHFVGDFKAAFKLSPTQYRRTKRGLNG